MQRKPMTDKMIVVGIDGFDPMHAKYMLDQGRMPNLAKLLEKGSAREDLVLLGSMPTVTPPMWTTLATGATARVHGITGFFNQHPEKLDTVIYALDSRMCKAEQLWNVFAEAGKKTLVWHWPGSSWPPTSDSPNLAVVDGTQPSNLGSGTAQVDWEKICLASEDIKDIRFAAHDASDKGVAGCVITDLDETVDDDQMTGSKARGFVTGKSKEISFFAMNEEETEVNMLAGSNVDTVNSPIKPATGWAAAPEDAKEFILLTSGGFVRRPCLILKNENGEYDTVAIYKNKKATEPIFVVKNDEFTMGYQDEVVDKHGETKTASRSVRILEMAKDGSRIKLWLSNAIDVDNDIVWHPKALLQEINANVGVAPLACQMNAREHDNVTKLLIPSWEYYVQWQADCLTYLMDNNRYDIIFSHVHNVDGLGHKFWHFAKYREEWQNDEKFYQEAMDEVYEQTDRYIGRFLSYIDQGWTVIVTSDHGLITEENHPPVLTEGVLCTPVMEELGFTVLKRDENGNRIREIDWEKTRAIITRGGQIYINLKGRDAHGIVEPEDKYALEDEIITALYNYRDPHTGRRVVAVALRNRDAVLLGEGGPECGDITLFMEEGFNVIHMDSLSTQRGYYHTSVSPFFAAAGPGIKENFKTDRIIRQVDVAPTMAVLGGVRMPAQNEGSVVHQILTEEF